MKRCVVLVVALAVGACGRDTTGRTAAAAPDSPAAPTHPLLDLRAMGDTAPSRYLVRFETTAGPLVIEVHRDWSPRGADRFYNLVQGGYFDSMYVHRVIPGGIAQFGFYPDPRINNVWLHKPIGDDPPVGHSNARGTITFAHNGMNTRTAQIFINLRDNPQFDDQKFVPFGVVAEGMDAVDAFYDGYGELAPDGAGPDPGQAAFRGNAYLAEGFPKLSQIVKATLGEEAGAARP
ncbi:MAG: peptidylprolyl isomerase [Gemmatimonadetes bacterium]|nr:peptidylprolyl isomerase [Gemmatimonadota bacterium]